MNAAVDPAAPLRATFSRGRRRLADEAEDLLLTVIVPVPLPRRRPPKDDVGTRLPARFVVELTRDEVRVLEEYGAGVVETWRRGSVRVFVHCMDEVEVVLDLRWPTGNRAGRIRAEPTRQAREVAELLASDTRVADGVDREGDAELRRLVARTLSDQRAIECQAAVGILSRLLGVQERPLVVVAAERRMGSGIAVLTDRRLLWGSAGRKDPLILAREEITAARCDTTSGWTTLLVECSEDRRVTLGGCDPPRAAESIAAAINPEPPAPEPPGALDALLAADPDESARVLIGRQLERVRQLLLEGERPNAFNIALRGSRIGVLVVTDRRVLWAGRKGEPLTIARGDIRGVELTKRRVGMRLELELEGATSERFDAVDPAERAQRIVAALE